MHYNPTVIYSRTFCRLLKIKQWVDENDPRGVIIPWSAALETQLIDLSEAENADFLKEKGTTR